MQKKSTTPTFDENTPITQGDIDTGKLVMRRREAGRVIQPKNRVTLYLDAALTETVRKVIREELRTRNVA